MRLSKGQNTTLDATTVSVACRRRHQFGLDADLSALLLSAGAVRSDEDFVFYNQSHSADHTVQYHGTHAAGTMMTATISCDLARLDPHVEAIAFAISLDAPAGHTLTELGPLDITVTGSDGAALAEFTVSDLSTETAVVAVEIYRRNTDWKLRAIGQGYSDGLAGLARDFGVTIDDEPTSAPPPPPPHPGAAPVVPVAPRIDWTNPPVPAGYEI
ncbi:TerD family protein [Rhodococcus sp. 14C212]|uniref:TerD family protein n=1 Tax=Rhodococcus sp. 14C212 TaxID=2711209 RepID=UPI0013ED40E3|nr:TerD family protein [Rhodococcus sp. 14C212]NGP09312.1 TerD family protein [Rhodococcus sp. 14C212]